MTSHWEAEFSLPFFEGKELGEEDKLKLARALIEERGDPVLYRGVRWYYLRRKTKGIELALKVLGEEGKLVRWSEKTPDLVQILE